MFALIALKTNINPGAHLTILMMQPGPNMKILLRLFLEIHIKYTRMLISICVPFYLSTAV